MLFCKPCMTFNNSDKNTKSETLLSYPSTVSETDGEHYERLAVIYRNLSEKYILGGKKNSDRQYYEMYSARLAIMRPKVEKVALQKWGNIKIKRLHELESGEIDTCIIVGTLFKKQELKPSILKELAEENQLMPQPVLEKFTSQNDEIILEDELQRIQLKGNINISELVTGVICGVKGYEETGGKFYVEDICIAGLPQVKSQNVVENDKFVLLTSGLELNSEKEFLLSLQLFIDYVVGHLGEPQEQRKICNIIRVVIAGNSISGTKEISLTEKVKLTKLLDDLLIQLAGVCPVDVMPGEFDPTNYIMPQQPLHHCLFPQASQCNLMQCVTNPYEFEIGGRTFLGTSGQNVKDIERCSELTDPIEVLERICSWGHVAPSAPDTLLSYPYHNTEPFVIQSCPDIIFVGNQKCLASKFITGPCKSHLLLSLPKFSSTKTCVLVNLRTLEIQPLSFDVGDEGCTK